MRQLCHYTLYMSGQILQATIFSQQQRFNTLQVAEFETVSKNSMWQELP
jgi:hypothetical protein